MKNLDEVFDIYQSFLDLVIMNRSFHETAKVDDTGKETMRLELFVGFIVELTNQKDVENSATLRCWWWYDKENTVETIDTLDQLIKKYGYL